jgi:subtilisin family serine protease
MQRLGAEVVGVKGPRASLAPMGFSPATADKTYVVRMDDAVALAVQSAKPPNMIVEEDAMLGYAGSPPCYGQPRLNVQSVLRSTEGLSARDVRIQVVSEDGRPVANAHVTVEGATSPVEGKTDATGMIALRLLMPPGVGPRSLFVDVDKDFWSFYTTLPALATDQVNVVQLRSIRSTLPGFPAEFRYGWGQLVMGLDQMPSELRGRGVKVAIVDSGCDNQHDLLRHLQNGQDYVATDGTGAWTNDVVGHGTHCAGVIAARGTTGVPFTGFVPDAEVHVLRIFPGGRFSSLLDALDYCIENHIDVVNMSLGTDQASETVEQKLGEALDAGVACIVAAGNSSGPVQYPGSSPNVFAVSALGKLTELLKGTWDAETVDPSLLSPNGFFSPTFTCFGPQVRACAPGVAIISTVPNNGFDPQSGTSMAAPHVTGVAALVAAHHPALVGIPRGRARVSRLFEVLRSACAPLTLGPGRVGFGLPQLQALLPAMRAALPRVVAPGLEPVVTAPPFAPVSATEVTNQIASIVAQAVAQAIQNLPQRLAPEPPRGADDMLSKQGKQPGRA